MGRGRRNNLKNKPDWEPGVDFCSRRPWTTTIQFEWEKMSCDLASPKNNLLYTKLFLGEAVPGLERELSLSLGQAHENKIHYLLHAII